MNELSIIHRLLEQAAGEGHLPDCLYCAEMILPWELAPMEQPHHRECALRCVIGSVAHLKGECSCVDTRSEEGDPPDMTKREAARAAVILYYQMKPELLLPREETDADGS